MKKLLVVVDMQNDFITGSLGTKEAQQIVAQVAAKIERCRQEGCEIIFTRDTHHENYLETAEGKKLPVKHCIEGSWGWEIEERLKKLIKAEDLIFNKGTFGSVQLGNHIKVMAEKEEISVELVGLCTDICVISNALLIRAFAPEVTVSVDASCCAGVTPESHENALKAMAVCQIEV